MPTTKSTTRPATDTCPECGGTYTAIPGRRTYAMVFHMINAGELSVGEARDEMRNALHDDATMEMLAQFVMGRADQGDHWRAGDPVTIPCGCRVSYDGEQLDVQDGCQADHRPALYVPC